MTYREAERIFRSIGKLQAAKAELMEAHQTTRGPDLSRVLDDIEEVQAHLRLIVWAELVSEKQAEKANGKVPRASWMQKFKGKKDERRN
jgi:hypothetical protein